MVYRVYKGCRVYKAYKERKASKGYMAYKARKPRRALGHMGSDRKDRVYMASVYKGSCPPPSPAPVSPGHMREALEGFPLPV